MTNLGNGYILQNVTANYATISWDNGSNKFTTFRFDMDNNDWCRIDGNHQKRLPKWVQNEIKKTNR